MSLTAPSRDSVLLRDLILVLSFTNVIASGWSIAVPFALLGIANTTLTPRFILNIRELHSRDVRGGNGNIDNGFGFSTLSAHVGAVSDIAFAEGQNPESEQGDDIPVGEQ